MFQPIWTCEKQGGSLLYKLSGRWNIFLGGGRGLLIFFIFFSNKRFSSVLSQLGLIAPPLLCSPLPLLLLMPGSATCRPFHTMLESLTPPLQPPPLVQSMPPLPPTTVRAVLRSWSKRRPRLHQAPQTIAAVHVTCSFGKVLTT